MAARSTRRAIPGYVGTTLLILATSLWTFWGVAEMFYEGWGLRFPAPLAYLVPAAVCLLLSLLVLTWPRWAGYLMVIVGGAFTAWWWSMAARRGGLTLGGLASMFPVSGMLIVVGVLFLLEARHRHLLRQEGWTPPRAWYRRHLRYLLALGIPLLVATVTSAISLPTVLTRRDDGDRGARLIEGNGVRLVWAPAGPGWSWGGSPPEENLSWNEIALYGTEPVGFGEKPGTTNRDAAVADMQATGLCRYLSADGLALMSEPQGTWRMPTTDEIVRSLVRDGVNAGCTWDGRSLRADCRRRPDKETPLWAPDAPPIYYWSADEFDAEEAYYVSFNGNTVHHQPKSWGNPRHGFRCVREP